MTTSTDWVDRVGSVWASEWRRTDRSFADLSRHLDAAILAAAPAQGTVLDIGCGAGATGIALATARPDLAVVGADVAPDLIAVARARSVGVANIRFVATDIQAAIEDVPPPALICSRHGVMFFDDPVATFTALRRAASPDAALVFSCFRAASSNPWASDLIATVTGSAAIVGPGYRPGPFGFADDAVVGSILDRSGWHGATVERVDYRYVAGGGSDPVADAVSFLRRVGPIASALRAAFDLDRPAMLDKLAAALQEHRDHGDVVFPAAAWIWRARASGEAV